MFSVDFTTGALKELHKLPKETQEHIVAKLERARIRPEHYFERLVGDAVYKLRVGEYRVIAEIRHEVLIILVIEVGHRRNIYKNK